jgi:predicted peptidase
MFMPDAEPNGDDPKLALAQGIGAVIWATPEEQEKHPSYVLAIEVPKRIHMTTDEYTVAPEFEQVKELLDKIVSENQVDTDRLYVTGQSQGCMVACELNWRYPDLFAASMLVAAHWDREKMTSLTDKKFFFGLSSGGLKEYPAFNEITDGLEAKGVEVKRVHLNFRDGWKVNNAKVEEMLKDDPQVGYAIFDKETAFPDDGIERIMIAHHNRGWELTYQLEPARDWLYRQHK